ncbi:nuclear transport factor 2 family protein [Pseudarthrobacter phenanthrenivorans]|uniref:nuclear transport factor 2 family protein n=1 Tax=Pseudarthrobacter phenanthrenivorans TaxID=361575 RepID=UPI00344FB87A
MTNEARYSQLTDTVARIYELERTKQLEPWKELWADDARVVFPLDVVPGSRDVIGKQAITDWTAAKFIERTKTELEIRLAPMADGRRVLAHVHVTLFFENGTTIGGPILVVWTFNEEGKVLLMEEYVNDATWPSNYKDLAVATS